MITKTDDTFELPMRFWHSKFFLRGSFRIAAIYVIVGAIWFFGSDWLLQSINPDIVIRTTGFVVIRRIIFLLGTGVIIFILIERLQRKATNVHHQLEGLVRVRTTDLQIANEDLASANEEFRAINEELTLSNERLVEASQKIREQSDLILRQKDEQLNRVLDHSNDAIFSLDLTGRNDHYLSRSCQTIFGREVYQHITDRDFWTKRTHPDDRSIRENGRAALARDGKVEIVTRMLSDDGQYRWIFERHRYEFSRDGKPVRQEGIASDITALKQTEQQLEEERVLLRSVIDHLPDYVYVKDRNLKHIIHNKANVELVGDVDLTGKDVVEIFGEAGRGYYEDDVRVLQSGKALLNREETILNKAGEQRILLTTKVPLIDKEGNTHGLVGISRDITDVRRQEAELNRYRENLDIIFSNSHENFLLLDHTGKVILFNKTLVRTIYYIIGREPTLNDYVWDITTPERREVSKKLVARVAAGESIHVEAVVPGESGPIILDVRYQGVFVAGALKYIIVISSDVTENRNQQRELNAYRENLDVVFSNTLEQILLLDSEGRVVVFNRAFENFLHSATGRAPQSGQYLWDVTLPERAEAARELFKRTLKGESVIVNAILAINGQQRIHELRYAPVLDENSHVRFVTVIATDVTDKWQQEQRLRESEIYLRTIFENTGELFVLTDRDLNIRVMNTAYENFRAMYGKPVKVGDSLIASVPTDRVEFFIGKRERVDAGEPFTYIRNFGSEENPHWMNVTFRRVGGEKEEFDGYCFSGVEVTQIQKARMELAVSEERFHELVRSSDDVFAIVNEQFQCTYVSPNVKRILGYDVTDWLNKSIAPLIHADDLNEIRERYANIQKLEEGTRFGSLRRILHRDGSWRWMEGTAISLYNTPGIRGMVVVIHDVTERKLREQDILSLKDSLSDFQNAIFRSSIVSRADRSGTITFVNENFVRISGYTKEELLGQNHRIVNSGYHAKEFWVDMWRTIASGQIWRKEVRNRAKDGSYYWVDTFVMPFLDEKGEVREFLSIRNDITERKKAEERVIQLNFSLADFKNAIHKSSIVSIANKAGEITYVNDNFIAISGYSEGELLGQNHRIINSGYHGRAFWVNMWKTITAGKIWREEVKNRAKDGSYYWVDTFVMPFLQENGQVREFLSIRNDITARKKAEEELQQNKLLLDKANEVARIGYWTYDLGAKRVTWNDRASEILELMPEFSGEPAALLRIVHPNDAARVQEALNRAVKGIQSLNIDHRVVVGKGSIKWIHQEAKEMWDEKGRVKVLIGIIQDITERKNSEEILREYNERYEILSRATNDAIWDWDIENNFEVWNHGLTSIFGYRETTITNPRNWWREKLHPEDFERVQGSIDEAFLRKDTNWSATYRYLCSDGTYKHVLDRAYVIYHENRPVRMIGTLQDMTEQRRYLEEIEKLSLVASKTNNSVIITDPDERIEWVNEAFTQQTGYSLEEVIGKKPGPLLQGIETNPETVKRISQHLKARLPISEEIVNYTKHGRKYWLKLQITPVFDEHRELQHFIAIQADVSEQKEYEQRITAIAREMTSLIENANVPVFGVDRNGYINEWNKVSVELSEYTKNDVLGKKWVDFLKPHLREKVSDVLQHVFAGEPVGNYELPFVSKGGHDLVFLVTISPRRDVNNNITGAICVAQDLTELIRYRTGLEQMVEDRTRELNEALHKEKDLVEMKSKFVSIASHEFRTPLTTISIAGGFLRKYKGKLKPDEIDKKIDSIEKQVRHMTYLLDDVLMLGKADAGKINVARTPIAIREWIERLVDEVYQSTGHTHSIVVKWKTDVSTFYADEKLMRNIFINLLNNAIKFSPQAALVNLEISSTGLGLRIRVVDYGIGIPPEDLPNLFEAFHRGGNVSTIQGTGLGMSITKKAVELLGGTIRVESHVNQGSEFCIELPFVTGE